MSLKLNSSGGGSVTIQEPTTASNFTLTLPAATGTVLTNSGTEAGAFSTLSVNGNNISAVNSLGFRNRIINGNMAIDQRNAGASVTVNSASGVYTVDRWVGRTPNSAGVFTAQQSTTAPTGFRNSLLCTVTTAATPSGTDNYFVQQRIEGFNVADLMLGTANAQTFTVSFLVRSSVTGTFGASVGNNVDQSYPFSFTISAANTFEQKTVTIPGSTSGTWNTTTGIGLLLHISLGAGSSNLGTANTWGNYPYAPTGSVNLISTSGATFYITGVQLEAGSVASPFERRDYGRELMMCQRYYNNNFQYIGGSFYSSSQLSASPRFPVTMRAAPTMGLSSGSTVDYSAIGVGGGTITPTFDSITTLGCRMYGGSGSASLGSPFQITSSTIQASAEL
jgi:hypothetical protein